MTRALAVYKKLVAAADLEVVGVEDCCGKHGKLIIRAVDGRTTVLHFHRGRWRDGPGHRQNIEAQLRHFKEDRR